MTEFRTLDDASLAGQRVLVRVDLNVPTENGRVTDRTRIARILPTIQEIADKGGRVVLLAHFGRPKGAPDEKNSLKPVAAALSEDLGRPVAFVPATVGDIAHSAIATMKDGDVVLLENTRFHAGEEANEPDFIEQLAALGRHLRQRRLLGRASRPRLDGGTGPQTACPCGPDDAGRTRSSDPRARQAGAPARRHRRRCQGVDQARTARQPCQAGRCAGDRRRHGQHVPGRAGQGRRQVPLRA